jgi:hypothetical protein
MRRVRIQHNVFSSQNSIHSHDHDQHSGDCRLQFQILDRKHIYDSVLLEYIPTFQVLYRARALVHVTSPTKDRKVLSLYAKHCNHASLDQYFVNASSSDSVEFFCYFSHNILCDMSPLWASHSMTSNVIRMMTIRTKRNAIFKTNLSAAPTPDSFMHIH